MPYIKQEDREHLDKLINDLARQLWMMNDSPGNLNYVFTRLSHSFLGVSPNYMSYNALIGIFESAKLEMYRRAVSKYEDEKIDENGDV